MNVLLSWSGDRSRMVAEALYEWLPSVVGPLDLFMSPWESDRDRRWLARISRKLSPSGAGVLCLTRENLIGTWLFCDGGAIEMAVAQESLRCTYLLDLEPADVVGRVATFQATCSDRQGTLRLVSSLNAGVAAPLAPDRLEQVFATGWPDLDNMLKIVRALPVPQRHGTPPQSPKVDAKIEAKIDAPGEWDEDNYPLHADFD